MSGKQQVRFKDDLQIEGWLETALEKEREKYAKCPVVADAVPGHAAAQGWGFVVAGYSLLEQALKAVARLRGNAVPTTHGLADLFKLVGDTDRDMLREYYTDFRRSSGGSLARFRFASLDEFLGNLDGDCNEQGRPMGSLDWRYYLIEKMYSQDLPLVSVDYLHEIVFGCVRILQCAEHPGFNPRDFCRSRRLHEERMHACGDWLDSRLKSDGLHSKEARYEILWGPDYQDRYDLLSFRDGRLVSSLSKLPDDQGLLVVDKRDEIKAFTASCT